MSKLISVLFIGFFVYFLTPRLGGQIVYGGGDLEEELAQYALRLVAYTGLIVGVLIIVAMSLTKPSEGLKQFLFWGMVSLVSGTTLILIITTVNLNRMSWSKGPVHWHADVEVWGCGQEVNLKDPQGRFSNKIGTATLHEHNDKRIHLEGVAVSPTSATISRFFEVIGGNLSYDSITVPTNSGNVQFSNGQSCTDDLPGLLQVFVYTVNSDQTYSQHKLVDPSSYSISQHSQVPPGDCIIVEFDSPKHRTDHLCKSFEVANQIGKLKGEVQK